MAAMVEKRVYRPEIDGLRAVAVLLVVLYHLGFNTFSGGFIGVDVFFVISGYIITGQILEHCRLGRFSYIDFLKRRFWRLFPALIATVFVSTVCSALVFSPEHTVAAARAAATSVLAWSNFFYWSQSGYFDADAILKPLLHTWSLSVEVQFYLVWPLIVVVASTITGRAATSLLVLTSFALMLLSEVWVQVEPTGAYLLLPSRAFEFGVGALLVRLVDKGPHLPSLLNLMTVTGAVAIFLPALIYDASTPFPGLAALLPCSGAALIIYSLRHSFAAPVLGHWLMAALGRASYSIYLVHWPVIVFLSYGYPAGLPDSLAGFAISLTLILAALQYRLIEKRFRYAPVHAHSRYAVIGSAMAATIFLCVAGVSGKFLWSWRYSEDISRAIDPTIAEEARRYTWALLRQLNKPFEQDGRPKVLLIGDSQAGDVINMLSLRYGDSVQMRSVPSSAACQILANPEFYEGYPHRKESCLRQNAAILQDARVAQADAIVLAFAWLPDSSPYVSDDVRALTKLGAGPVVVIGPKTQASSGMDLVADHGSLDGLERESYRRLPKDLLLLNAELSKAATAYRYVDLLLLMCPPGRILSCS